MQSGKGKSRDWRKWPILKTENGCWGGGGGEPHERTNSPGLPKGKTHVTGTDTRRALTRELAKREGGAEGWKTGRRPFKLLK